MRERDWRDRVWDDFNSPWDVIIVGGGITGAGILREATRAGLRTLLLEAHDFASGTSSRSSKLVHGGFRYLKNAQIKLTIESVREREKLLREGRGLINPLGFLLAIYRGDRPPIWILRIGMITYDLLAMKWGHRFYDAYDLRELCPHINGEELLGGFRYFDAMTDDSRLVLRVITEAIEDGGTALNYTRVLTLLRKNSGRICGVVVRDETPEGNGRTCEINAQVVINASGAWADSICWENQEKNKTRKILHLRKLRGSHLIFPSNKIPITRAICVMHPIDRRFVYAFPWEGVTLIGTTDVDFVGPLQTDPKISKHEFDYLMSWVQFVFPDLNLKSTNVQATFAGVRPVVGSGKTDPSKETREHFIWCDEGFLTVTGGKLTTFRIMAHDSLKAIRNQLPGHPYFDPTKSMLNPSITEDSFSPSLSRLSRLRIYGRYGNSATAVIQCAQPGELESVGELPTLWAEIRWAARSEGIVHLEDLLLRRTRLGLILPEGGLAELNRIRSIAQPELGWSNARWKEEEQQYLKLWQQSYSPY